MNDETALTLCTLKDSANNFLWRSDGKTFGKPVIMYNAMPSAVTNVKPIAFGDFSNYWIIGGSPVSVLTLYEKFALNKQIGY